MELADHYAEISEWFGKLADWHDVVSWRQTDAEYFRKLEGEMFAVALIYRRMAQGEARRMQMRRTILTSILMVILLFALVGGLPAVAQSNDPLATNTPSEVIAPVVATVNGQPVEATLVAPGDEQPPVVVVEQPGDSTLYVIGLIVFMVGVLGMQLINHKGLSELTATVRQTSANKQLLDEATHRYMQSSMGTQDIIKLAVGLAGIIGSKIPGDDLAEVIHDFGQKVIAGTDAGDGSTAELAPRRTMNSADGTMSVKVPDWTADTGQG
jgi:hypothetical protein